MAREPKYPSGRSDLRGGVFRVRRVAGTAPNRRGDDVDRARIPLEGVAGKAELLAAIAKALGFPQCFGGNWDALEDSLSDLAWRPRRRQRSIVIADAHALARSAPDEFRTFVDILRSAARFWSARGATFCVLFLDPAGVIDLPDLADHR